MDGNNSFGVQWLVAHTAGMPGDIITDKDECSPIQSATPVGLASQQ
jgi:hypothetical protein